ncbi:MAG: hypothetical protein H6536_06990 [Bacteroidales bacterium]|nr:hypothetical protein [Bacteroidales bacterium]
MQPIHNSLELNLGDVASAGLHQLFAARHRRTAFGKIGDNGLQEQSELDKLKNEAVAFLTPKALLPRFQSS